MARRNNKAAKLPAGADSETLPSFDENALLALTSRIEQGLSKGTGTQLAANDPPMKKKKRDKSNASATVRSKSAVKASESARGTKRDANGNAKVNSEPKAPKRQKDQKDHKGVQDNDDKAVLLQEILALGGTEEDLDLVADATSEDENHGPSAGAVPDKSFQKELANFVVGLGIEGQTGADTADSEEESESEEDEGKGDWEETSGSDPNPSDFIQKKGDAVSANISSSNDPNCLVFEARPDWHAASLPALPAASASSSFRHTEFIANLKQYALSLLEEDSNLYASKHLSSSSSQRFLSTIMSSGTLSDKISALTLVIQESPVHTTKSFENLIGLAKKRSRAQAVNALGALKDLLGNGVVLPTDRRLRVFANQPGLLGTLQENSVTGWQLRQRLPGKITKSHLISWAYEDWLKEKYFDMLKILEGWCNDEVSYARSRAVTYVYELLKEKPEQETNLLRLLVNKLGDPDKKISSRTSYLLLQLQISHPLMKPIVISSIETELLLRPGQSSHAKYYAINTLNQTILRANEDDVAKKLLDIYFELFVSLLKKPDPKPLQAGPVLNRKGQTQGGGAPMGKKAKEKAAKEEEAKLASQETTEKMVSAVLTGVNRAFPFSKADDLSLEKHMDTLFRITHSSNFNTSIQALMLIEQLATTKQLSVDRFYRTLYESLLDPRLVTSSKHALYLNLLFRALRADLNIKRVKAFAKRLLQIVTLHQPPFICGIIYLLRELETTFPGLKTLLTDPEAYDEDDEEVFRDVAEDGEPVGQEQAQSAESKPADTYDGRKRDPEHSNADKSCLWEAIPFLVHFHPSVALFASRLVSSETMPPKPDLASHTLSAFLDRFVYRNAKLATDKPRGSSIMQPLSGGDNKGILLSNKSTQASHQPLNTEAFWRKKAEDVAVDEAFFHKYFSQIGKGKLAFGKKKAAQTKEGGDEESEGEDEIWKALVESRPELEGDSDDSDMEMLDLDDSDAEEASEVDVESDDGGVQLVDADEGGSNMAASDAGEAFVSGSEAEAASEDEDDLFTKELETTQSKKDEGAKESSKKRRKLKNLPTFASVEDYAEMLDNDEDEDV